MTPENPYSPGCATSESAAPTASVLSFVAALLLKLLAAAAFACLVAGAIWLFYNGYPWTVAVITIAGAAATAFFAADTRRQGTIWSLSVPSLFLGGFVGFRLFFAMFAFNWFLKIFNDDGTGPLGLISSVFGFAAAAFAGSCFALDRVLPRRQSNSP